MPIPIDELLISVRIEQGSNLMELFNLLQDLQRRKGPYKDFPTRSQFTQRTGAIRNLTKNIQALQRQFPEHKKQYEDILREKIQEEIEIYQKTKDRIDGIGYRVGDLASKIDSLQSKFITFETKLGEIEVEFDADEFIRELDELIRTFHDEKFEDLRFEIKGLGIDINKLPKMATMDRYELIMAQLRSEMQKIKSNFQGVETSFDIWRADMNKRLFTSKRGWRMVMKEQTMEALKAFKDTLDENIEEKLREQIDEIGTKIDEYLEDRFREFELEDLEEVDRVVSGISETPLGLRAFAAPLTMEDISGFWRELISKLSVLPMEYIKEHPQMLLSGMLGRRMEEFGQEAIDAINDYLGLTLTKEYIKEQREPAFLQILDKIQSVDVTVKAVEKNTTSIIGRLAEKTLQEKMDEKDEGSKGEL